MFFGSLVLSAPDNSVWNFQSLGDEMLTNSNCMMPRNVKKPMERETPVETYKLHVCFNAEPIHRKNQKEENNNHTKTQPTTTVMKNTIISPGRIFSKAEDVVRPWSFRFKRTKKQNPRNTLLVSLALSEEHWYLLQLLQLSIPEKSSCCLRDGWTTNWKTYIDACGGCRGSNVLF